jgi:NAD(P)-dependent dehydrogenase (short-subunit alcohol dehydrogenase family)
MRIAVPPLRPEPPLGLYGVSKTALLGLTRALAMEMGSKGIRVNGVLPGVVPTSFSDALMKSGMGVHTPDLLRFAAAGSLLISPPPFGILGAIAVANDDSA